MQDILYALFLSFSFLKFESSGARQISSQEVAMMFEYLDNLFHSATRIGCLILVSTTCILIIYLLFRMTYFIEFLMLKNKKTETDVVIGDKEIHINIGNRTVEFHSGKIERLFLWAIGVSYAIGLAFCYAILIVAPLLLILIFGAKKLLKIGVSRGVKSVLRLPSA